MQPDDEVDVTADPVLARAVEALRPLRPADPAAIARIMAEVTATPYPARRSRTAAWVAGLALAAGLGGLLVGRTVARPQPRAGAQAAIPAVAGATTAAAGTVAVDFELARAGAGSVALVGDFNGWDPKATRLAMRADGRGWRGTVSLPPGRHVYAFVVDDSIWVTDAAAPRAADDDFGRPQSVVVVPTP
ncbi:MAG: isoamylase early set domain-containing protein [Gemmatimonadales bacterium]|nr:isoamylase early set domain-containing protein [Gemmatimonadales bacterium]